jgi:hypothetical protein
VSVFEVFDGLRDDEVQRRAEAAQHFEKAVTKFYMDELLEARQLFRKALALVPDDVASKRYLRRVGDALHGKGTVRDLDVRGA